MKKKKVQKEKTFDRDWHDFNEVRAIEREGLGIDGDRVLYRYKEIESLSFDNNGETLGKRLREREENKPDRARKGLNGISSYGARMVRNACYVMEQRYGKDRLGLLTPTLPNIPEYLYVWTYQWDELMRKLTQEIVRELERKGAPLDYVGVDELHPNRSIDVGWGVPHSHFLIPVWDGKSYLPDRKREFYISANKFRTIWYRILINEVKAFGVFSPEIKMPNARIEVKTIKKSAEGYLGKYLSKGKKALQELRDAGVDLSALPAHWWHCANELRKEIKGEIQRVPVQVMDRLIEGKDLVKEKIAYYVRAIKKEIDGQDRLLGWVFKLLPDWELSLENESIQPSDSC